MAKASVPIADRLLDIACWENSGVLKCALRLGLHIDVEGRVELLKA